MQHMPRRTGHTQLTDYASARRAMVENQVETSSVTDQRLLKVLRQVPREQFVPPARRALAYSDSPHPLGKGRILPAPAVFARLVQLAAVAETDRVLDYGCGNGYSTAVLAGLARQVIAFDPDAAMADAASTILTGLAIDNARITTGEYSARDFNTFDVIMVEGAVDAVPDALIRSLAPGGRLVCLVRQGPTGVATLLTNTPQGVVTRSSFNATLPLLDPAPVPEVFEF